MADGSFSVAEMDSYGPPSVEWAWASSLDFPIRYKSQRKTDSVLFMSTFPVLCTTAGAIQCMLNLDGLSEWTDSKVCLGHED